MICEKCWQDAEGDASRYGDLIQERNLAGDQCSLEEQCGERHLVPEGCQGCRCGKGGVDVRGRTISTARQR